MNHVSQMTQCMQRQALRLTCLLLESLVDVVLLPEVKGEVSVLVILPSFSSSFRYAYVASCFRKCKIRCHDDQSSPRSYSSLFRGILGTWKPI